jgi:FkbM family methyltransferase
MRLLRALTRPEYLYRPVQLWRRLRRRGVLARGDVRLAWGLPIEIDLPGFVSTDILNLGLHDRIVPEAICRLLEPGEWAVDAGANVGQNASMMALVAGPRGRVLAFEPHPALRLILERNVARWRGHALAPIDVVPQALSARAGAAYLYEDEHFASNRGSASLEAPPVVVGRHAVELTTLDAWVPRDARIGFAKLDVEGHERAVLEGAARLLAGGQVRDLIFEDLQPQSSPVAGMLEAAGYSVFALCAPWPKPCLIPRGDGARHRFHTDNYLATLDPGRARARFRWLGWRCLRVRAWKAVRGAKGMPA